MAICKVIKQTEGWNIGDTVEAFGARIDELIREGLVEVIVPDEIKTDTVLEAPKRGRKKGV